MEDKFKKDDAFFILRPENLDQVETRLYGYCVCDDAVITETEKMPEAPPPDGAYVYIRRDADTIRLYQDFQGSYGLYLFKDGDEWSLSNSFWYLVDAVKKDHRLTFNMEYADHLLPAQLASMSAEETLVNEITCINRAAILTINIPDGTISQEFIDYREKSVDPGSSEGIEILDRWYLKWTGLIKALCDLSEDVQTDLSGGFDSRLVLGLFLGSGTDLNDICVRTMEDELHTHREDMEIASEIGKFFGFSLNGGKPVASAEDLSERDTLNIFLNIRLGFHTQLGFEYGKRKKLLFAFNGYGGGCIRDLSESLSNWADEETLVKSQENAGKTFGPRQCASAVNITRRSIDALRKKCEKTGREIPPQDLCILLYPESRGRNHFGKREAEFFQGGILQICPLLDASLCSLRVSSAECEDKNLLYALICVRYMPQLLNFRFEGGRTISSETIRCAQRISERYPAPRTQRIPGTSEGLSKLRTPEAPGDLSKLRASEASGDQSAPRAGVSSCDASKQNKSVRNLIRDAFYSDEVKRRFESIYSERAYYDLAWHWMRTSFYPESKMTVALAIVKAYSDCADGGTPDTAEFVLQNAAATNARNRVENKPWFNPELLKHITARVDLKNSGDDGNDIELLEISDKEAFVDAPDWLKKNGSGHVIQSQKGRILIKCRCRGDGLFSLTLRSIGKLYENGKRIPYWIDYTSLEVNGEGLIDGIVCVSHDVPFKFERESKDGDLITISLSWMPHDEQRNRRLGPGLDVFEAERKRRDSAERALRKAEDKCLKRDEKIKELKGRSDELSAEVRALKREVSCLTEKKENLEKDREDIINSHAYKIGRALTAPARKIKKEKNDTGGR